MRQVSNPAPILLGRAMAPMLQRARERHDKPLPPLVYTQCRSCAKPFDWRDEAYAGASMSGECKGCHAKHAARKVRGY